MRLTNIGNEEMQRSLELCTRKTNNMQTSTEILSNITTSHVCCENSMMILTSDWRIIQFNKR